MAFFAHIQQFFAQDCRIFLDDAVALCFLFFTPERRQASRVSPLVSFGEMISFTGQGGAARCVRPLIPRGRYLPFGSCPCRSRGFDTWRPPAMQGHGGFATPTAEAAPPSSFREFRPASFRNRPGASKMRRPDRRKRRSRREGARPGMYEHVSLEYRFRAAARRPGMTCYMSGYISG